MIEPCAVSLITWHSQLPLLHVNPAHACHIRAPSAPQSPGQTFEVRFTVHPHPQSIQMLNQGLFHSVRSTSAASVVLMPPSGRHRTCCTVALPPAASQLPAGPLPQQLLAQDWLLTPSVALLHSTPAGVSSSGRSGCWLHQELHLPQYRQLCGLPGQRRWGLRCLSGRLGSPASRCLPA